MGSENPAIEDAEWEAKFNGARERLFKKIFGDKTLPIKDYKKIEEEERARMKKLLDAAKPKYPDPPNPGIREWNEAVRAGNGKVVRKISEEEAKALSKDKPDPVK